MKQKFLPELIICLYRLHKQEPISCTQNVQHTKLLCPAVIIPVQSLLEQSSPQRNPFILVEQ